MGQLRLETERSANPQKLTRKVKNVKNSDLFDRIQRLLALAGNNPNEHERQLAFLKAQELMLRHNISVEELGQGEEAEKFVTVPTWETGHRTLEFAAYAKLAEQFGVKCIWDKVGRKNQLLYFGREGDIKIARYTVIAFSTMGDALWQQVRKQNGWGRGERPSYFWGLAKGYIEKLEAQKRAIAAQNGALVVVEQKLAEAFNKAFPYRSASKRLSVKSRIESQGFEDGKKLNLAPGLGGFAQKTLN